MYESDQKETHDTFKRHIKQVSFNTDNRVLTLMGSSPGLGDKRATDIINYCGTPWNFFSAGWTNQPAIQDWKEVTKIPGIGEVTVRNALRNLGRPDV
jgi:DNA uptake protein ComE-like DNA-binding protein